MSAIAQMEKLPMAKSGSLKAISKTVADKLLCVHQGERGKNDFNTREQLHVAELQKCF